MYWEKVEDIILLSAIAVFLIILDSCQEKFVNYWRFFSITETTEKFTAENKFGLWSKFSIFESIANEF